MKLLSYLKDNVVEYYTLALLVIGIPVTISMFTDIRYGIAASVLIQACIGILAMWRNR